ncbi:MAG: DUF262 domain-containing protein [Planctomycetota bacterium]|nr:DUF262 domain-containing protein [Planctomycetota bacterium]
MTDESGRSSEEILGAVDVRRKRAETKSLDISLNELADMYESGELKIRPEYQRLFRWSVTKQSQFIESLLLEMPVPAIFVIEVEEGRWELIDGLQRLSTYLHYRGKLNAPEHRPEPITPGKHLVLEDCDILEELNGSKYDDLPLALQIRLKRSFLRVETIRQETDAQFRYHMFKRLNTGGEPLSDQEVRNCTIRLIDDRFNSFLIDLSKNSEFEKCIESLSDERRRTMGDVELVLRFFAFKNNFDEFRHDVSPFLTDYMERVSDPDHDHRIEFDYDKERRHFEKVFGILAATLGGNTCIRWLDGDRYSGQFLMHHYEAITLGLAKVSNELDDTEAPWSNVLTKFVEIKKDSEFVKLTTGGGQNSPGPYRAKIDFVADRLRKDS